MVPIVHSLTDLVCAFNISILQLTLSLREKGLNGAAVKNIIFC